MKRKLALLVSSLAALVLVYAFTIMLLRHVNASAVVWLLFWITVPFQVVARVLADLLAGDDS